MIELNLCYRNLHICLIIMRRCLHVLRTHVKRHHMCHCVVLIYSLDKELCLVMVCRSSNFCQEGYIVAFVCLFVCYRGVAVHVEQLVRHLSVCLCVQTKSFERNGLSSRYLACWFTLTLSSSSSNLQTWRSESGQSSRSQEVNVAKVVGATTSGGFFYSVSLSFGRITQNVMDDFSCNF